MIESLFHNAQTSDKTIGLHYLYCKIITFLFITFVWRNKLFFDIKMNLYQLWTFTIETNKILLNTKNNIARRHDKFEELKILCYRAP